MLSRYFYHGLNGQLCPEYFQKGPRNFFFGGADCPDPPRRFLIRVFWFGSVLVFDSRPSFWLGLWPGGGGPWMMRLVEEVGPRASRIKDQGSRIKDKDRGSRTRIKDHGPCFGSNEHTRRDTDVILRLSRSTIEDLSFYIGFTMELLASRILDLVLAWMAILEGIRTWYQDCPNLQSISYHFIQVLEAKVRSKWSF